MDMMYCQQELVDPFSESQAPILPASETLVGETKFPQLVLRSLDASRRSRRYTDMVVQTSQGEFHVHRVVMAAVSRTVAMEHLTDESYPLFTHNGPTGKTSHAALAALIEFAYSGSTRIHVDNVEGVLSLALHFQVPYLITVCQEFIVEHMSESTIIKFLEFSQGYPLPIIKAKVFRYIQNNLKYLMESQTSKLMSISASAISEFISYTDETGHKNKGEFEGRLELAVRYVHTNVDLDENEEHVLVEAVKSLVALMPDKGLVRCLQKLNKLIFRENVRSFLLQTGVCLKNFTESDVEDKSCIIKSSSLQSSRQRSNVDFSQNKSQRHMDDLAAINKSPNNSRALVNSLEEEAVCTDLRKYQTRKRQRVRHQTLQQPASDFIQNRNTIKSSLSRNSLDSGTGSESEEEPAPGAARIFRVRSGNSQSMLRDENVRTMCKSKSYVRRFDLNTHNSVEIGNDTHSPPPHEEWVSRRSPQRRLSKTSAVSKCSRSNAATTDGQRTNGAWHDSARFAYQELDPCPDLSPKPDPNTRLCVIDIFYQSLPEDQLAIAGLRASYRPRSGHGNYCRTTEVGVMPPNPKRYDVIKLKEDQCIVGVAMGVSDVIHWMTFYTSDRRMFGPFGHQGGRSVRVEPCGTSTELYSLHGSSRTRDNTDFLANVLFRWIRPPQLPHE